MCGFAFRDGVQGYAHFLGVRNCPAGGQQAGIIVAIGENDKGFFTAPLGQFFAGFSQRIEQSRTPLSASVQDRALGSVLVGSKILPDS
jgi:hypothetical protein